MMFKLIFLVLFLNLFLFNKLNAQNTENIDQKTYQLFQNKMYKKLIFAGEKAINGGTDYFYLRERIGISYYELKNYRSAILNFEKALTYNSDDPTVLEYLYYAYLFAGRNGDANLLASEFPDYLKEKIKFKRKYINSIYFEGGPSLSNNIKNNSSIDIDGAENIYGENDQNDNLSYFHLGLKHEVLPRLSIYHGISKLSITKQKKFSMNNSDTVFDYKVSQSEYYINADFQLNKGMKLTPAFHLINVSSENINAAFDTVNLVYIFNNSALNLSNYVFSLSLSKEFKLFSPSVFVSYSNLNKGKQFQLGTSINYFPFGNLNCYSGTTLTFMYLKTNIANGRKSENRLIFDQLVGVRIFSKLWSEASVALGNLENYNEKNAFIVYNIADKINLKASLSFIYALNKNFELSLRYQYLKRENTYLYFKDASTTQENLTNYQNNTVIGGIKWKL